MYQREIVNLSSLKRRYAERELDEILGENRLRPVREVSE
jgi:hypothetical protein